MHSSKQSLTEKTEPKENWVKMWSSMSNSLSTKDVYYALDEIKFGYACDLVKPHYQSALEVGCGSARVSCFFAKRGFQCACLDYTEEALRVARENFRFIQASGTFIQGEADRIPFPDGHFDVVFSTGLLEHFEHPELIVAEMVRVLRPGGLLWSDIMPKKFSLLRAFEPLHFYKLRGIIPLFELPYTRKEIFEWLVSAGLQEVQVFPAGVYPPLWVPFLPHFRWYMNLHSSFVGRLKWLWPMLDRTRMADWLGCYYFASGVKP